MTAPKKRSTLRVTILAFLCVLSAVYFYRYNYEVPILMYHHVGDCSTLPGPCVNPKTFERQMEFLKVHRYRVFSLEELLSRLRAGEPLPPKTVAITFDDGYIDNIDHAFPVLKKMGFPATIFMITRNIGQEGSLSEEDLGILDSSGVSIGSHTVSHSFLPNLDSKSALSELEGSKKDLEGVLGHSVTLFSYPAGGLTARSLALVKTTGYEGAVTTNYGSERHNPYALHRIKVGESGGSLLSLWIKTSGLYHFGKRRVEIKA